MSNLLEWQQTWSEARVKGLARFLPTVPGGMMVRNQREARRDSGPRDGKKIKPRSEGQRAPEAAEAPSPEPRRERGAERQPGAPRVTRAGGRVGAPRGTRGLLPTPPAPAAPRTPRSLARTRSALGLGLNFPDQAICTLKAQEQAQGHKENPSVEVC